MGYAVLACRVLTGLVFLVAVAGKARDFRAFAESVRDLTFVPRRLAASAARATVAAEGAAVLLLVLPPTVGWGFGLASLLDAAFTVVVATVLARGVSVSCHCFGGTPRRFGMRHLVRDVALTAAAVLGLLGTVGALGDAAQVSMTGPAGLAAVAAGLFGGVVVVVSDTVIELFAASPLP